MSKRGFKGKDNIIWVKGMKLGPGAPHDPVFQNRINLSKRGGGSGTVDDPSVIWLGPGPPKGKTDNLLIVEAIVRQQATECGLSYVWIASSIHATSTTAWNCGKRVPSHDDNHVTIRMGSSDDVCNLSGHIYLITEDNNLYKKPLRMMAENERGVKGGKSPQLWIWGRYPREWPRAPVTYPKAPFEVIPGSILSDQVFNRQNENFEGYPYA